MIFASFRLSRKLISDILWQRCKSLHDGYLYGRLVVVHEGYINHQTTFKLYDDSGVLLGECGPLDGTNVALEGIEFRMGVSFEGQEYEPERQPGSSFDEWNW
ncbi:MAG: hypothetical protein RBG13Loki_3116 [Promethearchaeota archaeon CR_4]|nr:MAG: hypothetical protein RBG13Loki_3116 [Candidatus Lokiarchaeota archaeon CR_4]